MGILSVLEQKLERVALNAIIQAMAAGDLAPDLLPQLIEVIKALGKMLNTINSREQSARLFGNLGMNLL